MFSYVVCGLFAAVVTLVGPRLAMRGLKQICPTFFSRLNCLAMFGVKAALWAYDDDVWGEDGEPTEVEMFPSLWKTTGACAIIFALASLLIWHVGTFGACFWLLVGACLPTLGAGLLLIAVGLLLLLLPGKTAQNLDEERRWKSNRAQLKETGSSSSSRVPADDDGIADRLYDFVVDGWEAVKKLPSTVGFAGVDRFYDRAKKRIVERRSST
jgi:hypothetical protein